MVSQHLSCPGTLHHLSAAYTTNGEVHARKIDLGQPEPQFSAFHCSLLCSSTYTLRLVLPSSRFQKWRVFLRWNTRLSKVWLLPNSNYQQQWLLIVHQTTSPVRILRAGRSFPSILTAPINSLPTVHQEKFIYKLAQMLQPPRSLTPHRLIINLNCKFPRRAKPSTCTQGYRAFH